MSLEKEEKSYGVIYKLLWFIGGILYPTKVTGRENLPEGACILCADHSSNLDPICLSVALGPKILPHYMCKAELIKIPLVGKIILAIGSFGVDRKSADVGAMRTAMRYLRAGEKLVIFPEGTRVSQEEAVDAKTGAVRLAAKLRVPLVPIYIPRKKSLFRAVHVQIGQPYQIQAAPSDYAAAAGELMDKIMALEPEADA